MPRLHPGGTGPIVLNGRRPLQPATWKRADCSRYSVLDSPHRLNDYENDLQEEGEGCTHGHRVGGAESCGTAGPASPLFRSRPLR